MTEDEFENYKLAECLARDDSVFKYISSFNQYAHMKKLLNEYNKYYVYAALKNHPQNSEKTHDELSNYIDELEEFIRKH